MHRLRLLFRIEGSLLVVVILASIGGWATTGASEYNELGWGTLFIGGFVLALQAIILQSVKRPTARRARGVPLFVSFGAGAFLVAAVVGGFAMGLWHAFVESSEKDGSYLLAGATVALIAWPIGTILFVAYSRRNLARSPESLLCTMARGILAGTAFEALAMVPLDVMIRKRSECYCVAGSVFNWAICVAVGVIVFGPAAVLPALIRERDAWYRERCDSCGERPSEADAKVTGYRGAKAGLCPHCGFVAEAGL